MNGREIENLLILIDQNVAATTVQLDREVIDYVKRHQDEVLDVLFRNRQVDIPTSLGPIRVSMDELESAAA